MILTSEEFGFYRDGYSDLYQYPEISYDGDELVSVAGTPATIVDDEISIEESGDFYLFICQHLAMDKIKQKYPSLEEAVAALLDGSNV